MGYTVNLREDKGGFIPFFLPIQPNPLNSGGFIPFFSPIQPNLLLSGAFIPFVSHIRPNLLLSGAFIPFVSPIQPNPLTSGGFMPFFSLMKPIPAFLRIYTAHRAPIPIFPHDLYRTFRPLEPHSHSQTPPFTHTISSIFSVQ